MAASLRPRGGVRIGVLLLGANAFVLMVPLLAILALRLYDNYLVRQTERQLIAQSVAIAEIYREFWLQEQGAAAGATELATPDFRPPGKRDAAFVPIEPVSSLRHGILPPQPDALPIAAPRDTAATRAGARISAMLRRMQVHNLSAVRILDEQGCVVATTRGEEDLCMKGLPEVASALAGHYTAVVRERISDEPLPPISEVRSRGSTRVFTALPVFSDGQVVAVVRASRTNLDARTSLWHNRRGLLFGVLVTALSAVLVSFLFAALIARPLGAITKSAQQIAEGQSVPPLPLLPWLPIPREIRTLGAALEVMTRRLRQRADYIAELAQNVSHELKTPITGIRGAAELLRDQWESMSAEQRHRFADNIDHDAARMQRLVSRLLHLAQIENAPDPTEKVVVDDFFRALAARYPAVTLTLSAPPTEVVISSDHLRSAVSNLLENALRHGAGKPVTLHVAGEQGRLRVEVRDQGEGISPANQGRLFQRFFTTARDDGGTGLGLAIVRAVAERQGGRVEFTTGRDGTTFTLVV
jgi:signal transduction histidine kinase